MAKQSQTPSFMDMFTKFGHDLKLPDVDIESILDHHRRNFEALEQSAKTAAAGASSLLNRQREMLQETLSEATEMARNYRAPGDAQKLIAQQTEFAKKTFESAVSNASEVAELAKKSGTESIDILRNRIKEAMAEVRSGYAKGK